MSEEAPDLKRRAEVARAVLADPAGRELLAVIDQFTGYRALPFNPDPHMNAYLCGRASVSVYLRKLLGLSPEEELDEHLGRTRGE